MKRFAPALVIVGQVVAPATAQPAPPKPVLETVIVTAPKLHSGITPNAIAHDFVKSFAMPSLLSDQIARWRVAICPDFEGIAPQYATVMEARFRTIAGEAGTPLQAKGCRPNLLVVVTPQPQSYLDTIHARNAEVLGYHGVPMITHPVQAWYVTGTTDIRGRTVPDNDGTLVLDFDNNCSGCPVTVYLQSTNTSPATDVGGWRNHPDASSDLLYATIIVDSTATGRYRVGEIADYVAMLALSRTDDYDDCQLMPSIANLLTSNCDDKLKPDSITPTDIAYLRGVYKMDPGAKLIIQQDQIAGEMAKTIDAKTAP